MVATDFLMDGLVDAVLQKQVECYREPTKLIVPFVVYDFLMSWAERRGFSSRNGFDVHKFRGLDIYSYSGDDIVVA